MLRLKLWQWVILLTPIASIIIFLLIAAGQQIHTWGINWIWAIFILVFVGWRWLLVKFTRQQIDQVESIVAEINQELETNSNNNPVEIEGNEAIKQAEIALQKIIKESQKDRPIWEDWQTFWQRCQSLVIAIANIYHPEVKYPLLNIYVPQAYGLIRGTMNDMDRWMDKLTPVLNQVTVGQAYQALETYRKLEPSARKLLQAWNWAQWLFNPAAAVAKISSQRFSDRASQELLINLSQLLRENALRNLCKQAISLYGGDNLPFTISPVSNPTLPKAKTQTLREILSQAEPIETIEQKPVNILIVGRTGAGKSSLINTIFQANIATVDILPSTDRIQSYQWQNETSEILTLWDTPGYEQVKREDLREEVIKYAQQADLLLLVTPALDPALQMDVDFLKDILTETKDLPAITIITQVDRLRPIREWEPPYNWKWGDRTKEKSIREATEYRAKILAQYSNVVLPVVTGDSTNNRNSWGIEALSLALMESIAPAKQLRLARFLRNLEARTIAAAKIIDHYTFQMTTTQGITALLKSPVLQFISTLSTGSPNLAYLLAEKIPVEQLPVVIGKLQMAYELFSLLKSDNSINLNFDLLTIWPLLLVNNIPPERDAWAFGHALVEFWQQNLTVTQLQERVEYYRQLQN